MELFKKSCRVVATLGESIEMSHLINKDKDLKANQAIKSKNG